MKFGEVVEDIKVVHSKWQYSVESIVCSYYNY
jgi:hypothetical protein